MRLTSRLARTLLALLLLCGVLPQAVMAAPQRTATDAVQQASHARAMTSVTAASTTCLPQTDVYPFVVNASLLASTQIGQELTIHLSPDNAEGGVAAWNSTANNASGLVASVQPGGSLQQGFEEDDHQAMYGPVSQINGVLEAGDWLLGKVGAINSTAVRDALLWHVDNQTTMRLPLWDQMYGGGTSLAFHFSAMARFNLLDFNLSQTWNGPSLTLRYLGDERGIACDGLKSVELVNKLVLDPTATSYKDVGTLTIYAGDVIFSRMPYQADAGNVFTLTLALPISVPLALEYAIPDTSYPTQYYNMSQTLAGADLLEVGPDTTSLALTTSLSTFQRRCAPQRDVFPLTFDWLELADLSAGDVITVTDYTFLDWTGGSAAGNEIEEMWTGHGNLFEGLTEHPNTPMQQLDQTLEFGDWLWGLVGAVSSIGDELDWHIANQSVMRFPLTDSPIVYGTEGPYELIAMARFELLGYSLSGERSMTLRYLGDEAGALCAPSTIVASVRDDRTGQLLPGESGTLRVYAGDALLGSQPFTTAAAGVFTATLTRPISQSVLLEVVDLERYPDQYAGGAQTPAQASPVSLGYGRNELELRLWRHDLWLPLVSAATP